MTSANTVISPVIEITLASEQGPQGPAGVNGTLVNVTDLSPSTPTVVDSVPNTAIAGVKWLVAAIDGVGAEVGFKEVTASFDGEFTVSGVIPDVDFDVSVQVTTDLELVVTNNEGNNIDLRIARIAVGAAA